MTARTLKIKIKLGNGDAGTEADIDSRPRGRRKTEPTLRTVPGAQDVAHPNRTSAPNSSGSAFTGRTLSAAGAAALLLGVLVIVMRGGTDEPETQQTAAAPVAEQVSDGTTDKALTEAPTTPSAPALANESTRTPLPVAEPQTTNVAPAVAAAPLRTPPDATAQEADQQSRDNATAAQATKPAASPELSAGSDRAAAVSSDNVARAQLTSAVTNREPTDRLGNAIAAESEGVKQVFFFTELRKLAGQRITHRWEFADETVANVTFRVGSDRWRASSSKYLGAKQTGRWRVSVVAEDGKVLHTAEFSYGNHSQH